MVKVREDMTGWKMWERGFPDSKLTVLKQVDDYVASDGKHYAQWLCECSCEEHNKIIVRGCHIRNGKIYSCGCINRERIAQIGRERHKTNEYKLNLEDEHSLYGVGYCTNTGREFYFDMDDYNKIKDYNWYDDYSDNYHRVRACCIGSDDKTMMHQLLFGSFCDHEDRDPMNNRRHNLRPATAQENARNNSIAKNNTSGITGVTWSKRNNKWVARINDDKNHRLMLGYFVDKKDAIMARLNAENVYYGKFAPQRHLFEQYGISAMKDEV